MQPLRAIDRPEEMTWAHEWVMRALKMRGLATTPQTEEAVSRALALLADEPPDRRTLSRLYAFLAASDDARSTLRHYLAGQGPYGELFDGVVESYGDAAVIGVETRDIIQLKDAAPLAVTAMFRAIQRDRLTGDAPKLVMVDEAWSLLGDEHFAGTLASWAREMRKLKAVLVLATQSLADLQKEETQVICDQIGNSIYLPQPEATRPETRRLYEAAGLTSRADPAPGHRDAEGRVPAADGGADPAGELAAGGRRAAAVRRVLAGRHRAGEGDAGRGRAAGRGVHPGLAGADDGGVARRAGRRPACTRRSRTWTTVPDPALAPRGARAPRLALLRLRPAVPRRRRVAAHRAGVGRRRPGQLLGHVPGLHRGVGGQGRRPGPVRRPRPRPGRRLGAAAGAWSRTG